MSLRINSTKELLENSVQDFKDRNPELLDQAGQVKRPLKYHNIPTESHGMMFQSGKEAAEYGKLMLGLRAGQYAFVIPQVAFLLQEKPEKIEYICDFLVGNIDGTWDVFDAKGMLTDPFKLKAKLFKKKYGREIKII